MLGAGHAPEVVAGLVGLWRDAVKAAHVEAAAVGVVDGIRAWFHCAGPDPQVRHVEFDLLPAFALVAEGPGRTVGGRRRRVGHQAHDLDLLTFGGHLHRRIHVQLGVAPDGLQMDITQVAQVEQVVVDQLPGRLVVVIAAAELVARVVVERVVRCRSRGQGSFVAGHPDPDDLVLLDHVIGLHSGLGRNAFLARYLDALPARRVEQAVVAAPHAGAFDGSARQRQRAMAATVF
ncbi:hypothetical protein D3C87_1481690 [compost metagenome]